MSILQLNQEIPQQELKYKKIDVTTLLSLSPQQLEKVVFFTPTTQSPEKTVPMSYVGGGVYANKLFGGGYKIMDLISSALFGSVDIKIPETLIE